MMDHETKIAPVVLLLFMLLALVLPGGAAARAEELPVPVTLAYVINLSNAGSPFATGDAEVWRIEAEVRLTVRGMTSLPAGQIYALWLVNPTAGHFLSVGRFNVGSSGDATLDVSLPGSLDAGYTMLLVTIQTDPDPHKGVPSHAYSIAGFFPGNSAIQHQVKYLPDTSSHPQQTGITPPAQPSVADATSFPWLSLVPLGLALLCFTFVAFRTRRLVRRGLTPHPPSPS